MTLQKTTEVGVKACNDVRNADRFCAINHLKESVVPHELNFNVDFTQCNPTTADGTKTTANHVAISKASLWQENPPLVNC